MTTVLDSGPLVAAAIRKDFAHERCIRLLRDLPGPLLLPDTVLAIAERLGVTQVATLDRRDFSVVRPRHAGGFRIVP